MSRLKRVLFVDLPTVALIFLFAFYIARLVAENYFLASLVADYGYIAVFILGIIGGLNIIIPLPAIAFLPVFLEAGLSKLPVIVIAAAGATVGDFIGYWIGRAGRRIAKKFENNAISRLLIKEKARPVLIMFIVFLYAAISPIPNEIVIIPLALLGYHWKTLIVPLLLGNIVFNMLAGYGIIGLYHLGL